jgi:hypothetical protein
VRVALFHIDTFNSPVELRSYAAGADSGFCQASICRRLADENVPLTQIVLEWQSARSAMVLWVISKWDMSQKAAMVCEMSA